MASATFSFDDSSSSSGSTSSSDLLDDASSSSSSSSFESLSSGPLFGMSELISQLPIKRGLSNYYKGKSQSFTSLSDARCIEDLAKKVIPCRKRSHKSSYVPKATISKKATRGSMQSL